MNNSSTVVPERLPDERTIIIGLQRHIEIGYLNIGDMLTSGQHWYPDTLTLDGLKKYCIKNCLHY